MLKKLFPSLLPKTEGGKKNEKQLIFSGGSEEVFMEEHITQGSPPPARQRNASTFKLLLFPRGIMLEMPTPKWNTACKISNSCHHTDICQ